MNRKLAIIICSLFLSCSVFSQNIDQFKNNQALHLLDAIEGEYTYFLNQPKRVKYEGNEKQLFSVVKNNFSDTAKFYRKEPSGLVYNAISGEESYYYQSKIYSQITNLPAEIQTRLIKNNASGSKNLTADIDAQLNFFVDSFTIAQKQFASPLSKKGRSIYNYDFAEDNPEVIYFEDPNESIKGSIVIKDSQLFQLAFKISKEAQLNKIDEVMVLQKFIYIENAILCLDDQIIEYEANFGDFTSKGKIESHYQNYIYDPELTDEDLVRKKTVIETDKDARRTSLKKQVIDYSYLKYDNQ